MDDTGVVSCREHVEHAVGDAQRRLHVERPPGALDELAEGASVQQLHDQEHFAFGRHVIVEHVNCAWMADPVGEVALALEALADARIGGVEAAKHLDRPAHAVAVGGRVDRRGAADAEQSIEVPLVEQRGSDA